ncbi:MAG: hypothetical protein EOM12_03505 [Verrucomicrobiae bacterium]|nr:hypothetical protein [Verrucomicrobiae bacterium]
MAKKRKTNNVVGGIYQKWKGQYENIGCIYAGDGEKWFRVYLRTEPRKDVPFYCVPRLYAPYIEGDMYMNTQYRKLNPATNRLVTAVVKVGHIHTEQSPDGGRTWYFGRFTTLSRDMIGQYLKVKE